MRISLLLCLLAVTMGLLIWHPFFRIDHIALHGLVRINEEDMQESIAGVVDFRRWFFFPGNNYFLVDLEEIRDILMQRFPLQSLTLRKEFPGKIQVTVEEKISTVIYDNGSMYSTLGLDGRIIEPLRRVGDDEWISPPSSEVTSTPTGTVALAAPAEHRPAVDIIVQEYGDYPIVYDRRHLGGATNERMLQPDRVRSIIEWFRALKSETTLDFRFIRIDNDHGWAEIIVDKGGVLRVLLDDTVAEQLARLKYVLEKEVPDTFLYIDLRYRERVYWQ